MDFTSGKVRKG